MGSTLKCFVKVTELSAIFVHIIDGADCWGSIFSDYKYFLEYLLFGLSDQDAVEDVAMPLDVDESIERQLA